MELTKETLGVCLILAQEQVKVLELSKGTEDGRHAWSNMRMVVQELDQDLQHVYYAEHMEEAAPELYNGMLDTYDVVDELIADYMEEVQDLSTTLEQLVPAMVLAKVASEKYYNTVDRSNKEEN